MILWLINYPRLWRKLHVIGRHVLLQEGGAICTDSNTNAPMTYAEISDLVRCMSISVEVRPITKPLTSNVDGSDTNIRCLVSSFSAFSLCGENVRKSVNSTHTHKEFKTQISETWWDVYAFTVRGMHVCREMTELIVWPQGHLLLGHWKWAEKI